MTFSLQEIVEHARERSPFYSDLYKNESSTWDITNLPIVDQKVFWEANSFKDNKLLTDHFGDGILFKSGGTTGNPKFSAFTKEEWHAFTYEFGKGISKGRLKAGDRVGNLFYSGDLYASFAFIMKSLEHEHNQIVQFPMTGTMGFEDIIKTVLEYDVNVLAGVPTTFINLASHLLKEQKTLPLELILFGGEPLYEDQFEVLKKAFPKAHVDSIGIASVDGGHLGFFDSECENGEHKVFQESTIVEIIDEETGEVIQETGRTGRMIYTNLTRKLMPIIRYPAGDMAEWTEVSQNNGSFQGIKYKLHGRSNEGARIGPVTIGSDDIHHIFHKDYLGTVLESFQLVVRHEKGLDQLTIVLVPEGSLKLTTDELENHFYSERPMLKDAIEANIISPIIIKIGKMTDLILNKRTGKQRLVVDLRESDKIK